MDSIVIEDMIYPVTDTIETLIVMTAVVLIAWLWFRHKKHKADRRTELMMRALEHSENAEGIINSLQKPPCSNKERIASSRALGLGFTILGGAGLVVSAIFAIHMVVEGSWNENVFENVGPMAFLSLIPLAIGIGFVIYSHLLREGQDSDKNEG